MPSNRSRSRPVPRPRRPAIRQGALDTAALVDRLRDLHELGEDPTFERFPQTSELFLALQHAQRAARHLRQPPFSPLDVLGEAAVLRARLWEYLREQVDAGQLRAVEDGRAVGVTWDQFSGALCVSSKQGAYQKAQRLLAEQVREPGERRNPEVARSHRDRDAARQHAERLQVIDGDRRFPLAQKLARRLLAVREELLLDDLAAYWLDELQDTIDDRHAADERARFTSWLESCVRAIQTHARHAGTPAHRSESAREVLELASRFAAGG